MKGGKSCEIKWLDLWSAQKFINKQQAEYMTSMSLKDT